MTDLALLEQYLIRLRQERLQQAHTATLGSTSTEAFIFIKSCAHEAELVQRILAAVKDLQKDPGDFIKRHLKDPV